MMRCIATALAVSFALLGCTYPHPTPPAPPAAPTQPPPAGSSPASQPPAAPAQSGPPHAPAASTPQPAQKGTGSTAAQAASPTKQKPVTPAGSRGSTSNAPSAAATPRPTGSAPPTATAPGPTSNAPPAAPTRAVPPAVAPPAAASLDLTSLERRLKDTKAIGLFTKLSLKNQVDDLLAQFRAFYQKKASTSLGDLRQRYDLLLLKVLSLLQDGDPPLASEISGSREAIWSILSDPDKFAKL